MPLNTESDSKSQMIGNSLTVTITDIKQDCLLRWLANHVYHTTLDGAATDLLAEALDAKARLMEKPL